MPFMGAVGISWSKGAVGGQTHNEARVVSWGNGSADGSTVDPVKIVEVFREYPWPVV